LCRLIDAESLVEIRLDRAELLLHLVEGGFEVRLVDAEHGVEQVRVAADRAEVLEHGFHGVIGIDRANRQSKNIALGGASLRRSAASSSAASRPTQGE
jgi:hypothetical protein